MELLSSIQEELTVFGRNNEGQHVGLASSTANGKEVLFP